MLKIKGYICIFLAFLLCLSFFGCGRKEKRAGSYLMKLKEGTVQVSSDSGNSKIFSDNAKIKELKKISETDMETLYFSEENLSVSVYDSGAGKIWRSLPEEYKNEKAGVISVTVLIDGNEYVLNSQSDSFSADSAEYEIKEDGISFRYTFRKTLESGTEIDFTVPVEFMARDGMLVSRIDCSALEGKDNGKNVVLKSISLLPYFGAFSEGIKGDGIVIPDGSGAFIDASALPKEKESYSVSVYGSDPSQKEKTESFATIPAFGMKRGEGAFVALIGEGAEIAEIKAEKSGKNGGFNRVYPEFEITPTLKNEDGSCYVSDTSFEGNIEVSYRFLSHDSADYIGMAGACRELLIRNGALTEGNVDTESDYPFNLSLIGVGKTTDESGNEKQQVLCSWAQSYDILGNLKAKDINSINLRYKGVLEGGINQADISKASLNGSLGSKAELDELAEYALSGNVSIFTDVSLFTAESFNDYGVALDGEGAVYEKGLFGKTEAEIGSLKSLSEKTKSMLSEMRKNDFEGICLSDGGSVLPSDFNADETMLRPDTAKELHSQIGAVSAVKKLMVERGNLYGIKYASVIVDLPENAFYGEKKGVKEIPFVQAVLHGIADYSLSPINLKNNSTEAILKCAEYGAVPYYEWYYADKGTEDKADKYYYMNSVSDAQTGYERMKNTFSDLRDKRITDHEEVKKNVFVTEYGGNTKIYVNYNEEAVTVSGVTVEGKGFIRVN